MAQIYYDLTELYLLTRGKLKFYGIARVVAEVAYEIHQLDPDVRFVIYDETRQSFFQITPHFGKASYNGVVDLGLPPRAVPFRLRAQKEGRSSLGAAFSRGISAVIRTVNWLKLPFLERYATQITLENGTLLALGRPKLMMDYIAYLERTRSKVKLYALLHDAIPLHHYGAKPKAFQKNFRYDNTCIIQAAHCIISNSAYTQQDLLAKVEEGLLPPFPRHCVVPLAHECRPDNEPHDLVLPQRPYVLTVGITLGRKNLDVVLQAQEWLLNQGRTPPLLVIAGANRDRTMRSLHYGRYAPLRPHVLMVNSPSQANLIHLYRHALATIMASRLEGWGLPLGESLWLGTPALSTPLSALPEVGRDLALYFDADSPSELAQLWQKLQDDTVFYAQLKERIAAAQPQLRSWRHVAQDLLHTADEA